MKVTVDFSDCTRVMRQEVAEIRRLPIVALKIAKSAADVERTSSTYRNRTGDLRGGTAAELHGGPMGFRIYLHQGAFYGVFVQARGYSDFTGIAEQAEEAIDELVMGGAA